MGYRVSWIALAGSETKALLDAFDCELTGEREEMLDIGYYLLEMPPRDSKAWNVIIADGSDHYNDLNESQAKQLSENCGEVIYFWCSDTVMATEMICYKGGELVWAIEYGCEYESGPTIKGDLPAEGQGILKALKIQQEQSPEKQCDYLYELTTELGLKIVGFRHDSEAETPDPEPFQALLKREKHSEGFGSRLKKAFHKK